MGALSTRWYRSIRRYRLQWSVDEKESLEAAIHEEVLLHPHDPLWPSMFAAERDRLSALLPGAFIELQHVGSTAIGGLRAKPIIDILAGVESMAMAKALAEPICASGYTTSAEFNASLIDRQWFMRWRDGHRTHHLHLVVHGGKTWREWITFRDRLSADGQFAARYDTLKAQLAERHGTDREAYTQAKSDFVHQVLALRP